MFDRYHSIENNDDRVWIWSVAATYGDEDCKTVLESVVGRILQFSFSNARFFGADDSDVCVVFWRRNDFLLLLGVDASFVVLKKYNRFDKTVINDFYVRFWCDKTFCIQVKCWELLVRSLLFWLSINRTIGTRGESDINDICGGKFILRKIKNKNFFFKLVFLFYIEFDMTDVDFISVVCEISDLVGVTGVIDAKRWFCLSRTDKRGFDLKNNFYKNEIFISNKNLHRSIRISDNFFQIINHYI
jgi:hypothetical protein